MARAKREQLNQKVPVTTYRIEPQPATYILELTEDEAGVLLSLMGHVSGQPEGRRGLMTNIQKALISTGLPVGRIGKKYGISGTVHFDYYNPSAVKTETAQNTSEPVKTQDAEKAEAPSVTSTGSRADIRRALFREAYGPMPTLPVMAEPALLAFERKLLAGIDSGAITHKEAVRFFDHYEQRLERKLEQRKKEQLAAAKVAAEQAKARLEAERKARRDFVNSVQTAHFMGDITTTGATQLITEYDRMALAKQAQTSPSEGAGTSPNQDSLPEGCAAYGTRR